MALRAVIDHVKFNRLKALLGCNRATALGYLECLWHFTGRFAPQGNIGRYSDEEFEAWAEWTGEDGALVAALVKSKWVDVHPSCRLLVHDWHIHADDATKLALKRKNLNFILPISDTNATLTGQCPDSVPTVSGLPVPEPEPEPVPEPVPEPEPVAPLPPTATAEISETQELDPPPEIADPVVEAIAEAMADERVWPPGPREMPSDAGIASLAGYARRQAVPLAELAEDAILTLIGDFRESHRPQRRHSEKPPIVVLRRWFERAGPDWASRAAEAAKNAPKPAKVVTPEDEPFGGITKPALKNVGANARSPGAEALLELALGDDGRRHPRDQGDLRRVSR